MTLKALLYKRDYELQDRMVIFESSIYCSLGFTKSMLTSSRNERLSQGECACKFERKLKEHKNMSTWSRKNCEPNYRERLSPHIKYLELQQET